MVKRFHLSARNSPVIEFATEGESESRRSRWVLETPYQRGSVWSAFQRQNLVLSLLRGIPIGAIYTNKRPFNPKRPEEYAAIVDGKQRVSSIRAFVDSELAVPAEWFSPEEFRGKLDVFIGTTCGLIDYGGMAVEGVVYSGLTDLGKRSFDRCTVAVQEAEVATIAEEAELYLLVNFGGVAQTRVDQRRAAAVAGVDPGAEGALDRAIASRSLVAMLTASQAGDTDSAIEIATEVGVDVALAMLLGVCGHLLGTVTSLGGTSPEVVMAKLGLKVENDYA